MQCVLRKVQYVNCLLSKLYAEHSQCVHCYWSTGMHRCCKCGNIPAAASVQMKKSLTLVCWWWQLRCCISDGKDTWRKENGLGLQTPHGTNWLLQSGFVTPLLSWDILRRGAGTWAWASQADVFGSHLKASQAPTEKVPAVPRGCLCPPRRSCWSTSTC